MSDDIPEHLQADTLWVDCKLTLGQIRAARALHDELTQETK